MTTFLNHKNTRFAHFMQVFPFKTAIPVFSLAGRSVKITYNPQYATF
jgi:hypothetical protein